MQMPQAHKVDIGPEEISEKYVVKVCRDLYEGGEGIFASQIESVAENNPYLLAVVAQMADIFFETDLQLACFEGFLCIYNVVRLKKQETKKTMPFVSEDNALDLANNLKIEDNLDSFVAKEITSQEEKGDKILLTSARVVQRIYNFDAKTLVAFCMGMIVSYNLLKAVGG